MPQVFGYATDVPAGVEERSIYTFVLEAGGGASKPAAGAFPASLRGSLGGGDAFQSNVVVIRDAARGRDATAFAADQRRAIADKMPGAVLAKEGKLKLGPLAAYELLYRVTPAHPLPALAQWHVVVERDGWCYDFCVTAAQNDLERDKKAARPLMESWAKGAKG